MSEHEHLIRIERKLDAVLLGTRAIIHNLQARRESDEMSKLHDDLKALAGDVDAAADRLISAKTESEQSLADVLAQFQATRDKLIAAANDDAAGNDSAAAPQPQPSQPSQPSQSAAVSSDSAAAAGV